MFKKLKHVLQHIYHLPSLCYFQNYFESAIASTIVIRIEVFPWSDWYRTCPKAELNSKVGLQDIYRFSKFISMAWLITVLDNIIGIGRSVKFLLENKIFYNAIKDQFSLINYFWTDLKI